MRGGVGSDAGEWVDHPFHAVQLCLCGVPCIAVIASPQGWGEESSRRVPEPSCGWVGGVVFGPGVDPGNDGPLGVEDDGWLQAGLVHEVSPLCCCDSTPGHVLPVGFEDLWGG